MRKKRQIDFLIPKTRQKLLVTLFGDEERWWYFSELARQSKVQVSSMQREIENLVNAGVVVKKADGGRVYFRLDADCPFLGALRDIIERTVGMQAVLLEVLQPILDAIQCAFIYGSWAKKTERSSSDIDLFIVGHASLSQLTPTLRSTEEKLGRPVNVSLFTPVEFLASIRTNNHFVRTVIDGAKIFLKGSDGQLKELAGQRAVEKPHNQP